jgi:hypothetical protein
MERKMKIQVTVNVTDPAALYEAALAAYVGTDSSEEKHSAAQSFLGTPDNPNFENCFAEIVCEYMANDAFGFEF